AGVGGQRRVGEVAARGVWLEPVEEGRIRVEQGALAAAGGTGAVDHPTAQFSGPLRTGLLGPHRQPRLGSNRWSTSDRRRSIELHLTFAAAPVALPKRRK